MVRFIRALLAASVLLLVVAIVVGRAPIWAAEGTNESRLEGESQQHCTLKVTPFENLSPEQLTHPLVPALRLAREMSRSIEREVGDYTCNLVMRERVSGRLNAYEHVQLKVRRQRLTDGRVNVPFSVYLKYDAPNRLKGREVLYVRGRYDGAILARKGGVGNLKDVTVSMKPGSRRATRGRHYSLTEIGMQNMMDRLFDAGQQAMEIDKDRRECQVAFIDTAKIEGRKCRCIQVTFPVERENLKFHIARVFLDSELNLPVRFAAYSWPEAPRKSPRLIEEYTFLNLQTNVGLTDEDFDRNNPQYKFYRARDNTDRQAGLR